MIEEPLSNSQRRKAARRHRLAVAAAIDVLKPKYAVQVETGFSQYWRKRCEHFARGDVLRYAGAFETGFYRGLTGMEWRPLHKATKSVRQCFNAGYSFGGMLRQHEPRVAA
jgi:hypothetical protein